jgi:hypothetical protein
MEPEDELLCSQEPATGPYPEPDESSPYFLIHLCVVFIHFHSFINGSTALCGALDSSSNS